MVPVKSEAAERSLFRAALPHHSGVRVVLFFMKIEENDDNSLACTGYLDVNLTEISSKNRRNITLTVVPPSSSYCYSLKSHSEFDGNLTSSSRHHQHSFVASSSQCRQAWASRIFSMNTNNSAIVDFVFLALSSLVRVLKKS